MKLLYIYIALCLLLLTLPGGQDVGGLAPAELVYVQKTGGGVKVGTDMGNLGAGKDLASAFEDLKNTTPGEVFLDTADYLLVSENSIGLLPELRTWLGQGCRVCVAVDVTDLTGAAYYLNAHPPGTRLGSVAEENMALPILTECRGRFCLKDEKT